MAGKTTGWNCPFYSETNFLTTNNPLPVPFLFNFLCHFFFYHPAPPSSVFLISVLGPTGFLLVSRPLLFLPISSHDERSSSTRVGENCLQLMTSFPCISFLQHECVQMTQVLSKSNFPFQFVITSAYIRRH